MIELESNEYYDYRASEDFEAAKETALSAAKRMTAAVRALEQETRMARAVIHVQNGRPMTALGARLMGVPWTGPAE